MKRRRIRVSPWKLRRLWSVRQSKPAPAFRSWSVHFYFRHRLKPKAP